MNEVVELIIFFACMSPAFYLLIWMFISDRLSTSWKPLANSKYKVKKRYTQDGFMYDLYRCKWLHKGKIKSGSNLNSIIEDIKEFKRKDNKLKNVINNKEKNKWLSDDDLMLEEL